MRNEVERMLYTCKRGFSILSESTRREIEERIQYRYEEYVRSSANHYIHLYKEFENHSSFKELEKEVQEQFHILKEAFMFLLHKVNTSSELLEDDIRTYAKHHEFLCEEMENSDWCKMLKPDTDIDTDELIQELDNDLTSKTCSINGEMFVLFLYEQPGDETNTYLVPVEVAKKLQLQEYEGQELDYYDEVFDDIEPYKIKNISTYNTD